MRSPPRRGKAQSVLQTWSDLLAETTRRELIERVNQGELVRIASGMYVDGLDLSGRPEQIHFVKVRAHAQRCAHVVSHVSAAVLHGLPVPAADLTEVHFSRPGSSGNDLVGDRRLHAGCPAEEWLTEVDGIRVTNIARTLIDLARTEPHLASVAASDAALHRGLTDPAELVKAFESELRWVGSPFARKALKDADGRAESPGETWARLALRGLQPGQELQFDVYDEAGRFVARADGGYPDRGLIWEYDGQGKYEELRDPGITREEVVARQQRREQRLLRLGWNVVRANHEDLSAKDGFRHRVAQELWPTSSADWRPPRGSYEVMAPLRVDIRDPIQWGAAMRAEIAERWNRRKHG